MITLVPKSVGILWSYTQQPIITKNSIQYSYNKAIIIIITVNTLIHILKVWIIVF